ncbi:carboxypeptidase-like regulatory domain-containing protein [uncultured Formosa sp.]|uniref:carboxypeptidase-like regulatory domain-containing protein n=1 Tax=uncultured Formosa sp. TaxID=255435 RepID=UPI0026295E45|nr:carboxypeptidase-like regulatory domain-containing protein [uncultured Formosa sp.]
MKTTTKILLSIGLIILWSCNSTQPEKFTISGQVTDFNGNPIDSVSVHLKNKSFENIYSSLTDKNGNYSLKVNKGDYYCLYAIKASEYRINKLEYWMWYVPVHNNMIINPQYDRIEIYGINVFEPQVTPQNTYMIYFRPMSLSKTLEIVKKQNINSEQFVKTKQAENIIKNEKFIDVSPIVISENDLEIKVNDKNARILKIQKIKEYAREISMYGYIVQIEKPEQENVNNLDYDKISIVLKSSETGEKGKGETFVKLIK